MIENQSAIPFHRAVSSPAGSLASAEPIIVCEPQCWGFEHASFNAALLRTVQLAFPGHPIRFFGERSHLGELSSRLENFPAPGLAPVSWEEIAIPERHSASWRRLPREFQWCSPILAAARGTNAQLLILASFADTGLLALKVMMFRCRLTVPTLAVAHGGLFDLLRPNYRPWSLQLRHILDLPHPPALRLIVLGDSIQRELLSVYPRRRSQWAVIDLPYLFPAADESPPPGKDPTVRFGYFGSTYKGAELFESLADEFGPRCPRAEFWLVGFVDGRRPVSSFSRQVRGLGTRPLTNKEYQERASGLSYCVFADDPEYRRLVASASFLDALAYGKPGLYLRNDYIEPYFRKLGDIGYLCENREQMRETVAEILREFPRERYQKQVENIIAGRKIFSPEFLAPRLRSLVMSPNNSIGPSLDSMVSGQHS